MPNRSVLISADDELQRTFVYIGGDATGPQVWSALCNLFESRPAATGYDMLFDLRAYVGDVAAEDVKPIVETYARVRVPEADGTRTAFLTNDPNFGFWAEAMNFQFPGRLHGAFADEESAEMFLAVPKGQR